MKRHLKRLTAPRTWQIKRKGIKFITRPLPGSHKLEASLPLIVILRDLLKIVKTTREANYLIKNKKVLVNGKVMERRFGVGLMDILAIKEIDKRYRIILDRRGKL